MFTQRQEQEYQQFIQKLNTCTEEELYEECKRYVWLSAYAANNNSSNYHRMCSACFARCSELGIRELYDVAWHYEAEDGFTHEPRFDDGKWDKKPSLKALEHYKKQKTSCY